MKLKLSFLLMVLFALGISLQGQVTIGTLEAPDTNALLDLKENSTGTSTKGLLPPRIALQSTTLPNPMSPPVAAGMTVYNTATISDVTPGYYYYDGTKWLRLVTEGSPVTPKFFYMPSIVLPVDPADTAYNPGTLTFTVDLYAHYLSQFNTPQAKNTGAGSGVLPSYTNSELNYFITYYDTAVFSNVGVSNSGELTYQLVTSPAITEKTYMNIVFEVK